MDKTHHYLYRTVALHGPDTFTADGHLWGENPGETLTEADMINFVVRYLAEKFDRPADGFIVGYFIWTDIPLETDMSVSPDADADREAGQ
jgi:hypothetical protein